MNGEILRFSKSTHQVALEALPWYATGTLDLDERAMVELHLEQCPQCREELAFQRRFHRHYLGVAAAMDCEPGLEKLLARLEPKPRRAAASSLPDFAQWAQRAWRGLPKWTAAALTAQLAVILTLGYWLERAGHPVNDYHTLAANSAVPPARGNVVLVVEPDTPEHELRRILRASGARVIDGPLASGGYVLDVPEDELPQALARMRKERAVTLAETLRAASPR